MDSIGARKVQPPEAVAHGTDNHIAPIYKIPVGITLTGICFILFCKYYNLWRCLCDSLFSTARGAFDFYSFQIVHYSKDLSATLIYSLRF